MTGKAVLLTFDNKRLGLQLENHALLAHLSTSTTNTDGKWRKCPSKSIKVEEDTLAVASALIQNRAYKDLTDFDNHLDDVSQDYLNVGLNMEIDRSS